MKAILTYHSIDRSGSPVSVDPQVFRAHHRWLAGGHVRTLLLDDLLALESGTEDAVAVTFDDGFLNAREPIARLLDDGVRVTIFAVTRHVGGQNNWGGRDASGIPSMPLLDWADLAHLTERGAAVAAHTRTHPPLTTLSESALEDEVVGAGEDLVERLGVRTKHVAYPYGDVDGRVVAAAARHYTWGHTTDFRPLRAADEALLLPRLDMYYFRTTGILEAWGTPRFARHLTWCQTKRRVRAALVGHPHRRTTGSVN
jgi:peptidoglycan/xylan/chitin deacetylase (PgdA/CDA1 family)